MEATVSTQLGSAAQNIQVRAPKFLSAEVIVTGAAIVIALLPLVIGIFAS